MPIPFRKSKQRKKNLKERSPETILLEKATGANAIVQDKYMTISVNKKNIETDERKYIKTAYGMGYQWIGGEPR